MLANHKALHKVGRSNWLRAAVLGANDGVISTASLIVGVAVAGTQRNFILLAGVSGLVAGAISMAAGEYVSVRSQADTEKADIEKEKHELETAPKRELVELTTIYMDRGLEKPLARAVAEKLMSADALGAHARDELGITETLRARPLQASLASAVSFGAGAAVPLLTALFSPSFCIAHVTAVLAFVTLAVLGGTAAYTGGAPVVKGALRVAFWGAMAMAITAGVSKLFGATF
jgi:vacuolar iron transporter family protein